VLLGQEGVEISFGHSLSGGVDPGHANFAGHQLSIGNITRDFIIEKE